MFPDGHFVGCKGVEKSHQGVKDESESGSSSSESGMIWPLEPCGLANVEEACQRQCVPAMVQLKLREHAHINLTLDSHR
jgi:hypothetical protein